MNAAKISELKTGSRIAPLIIVFIGLALLGSTESRAAERLRFAVLPLRPLAQCRSWVARKFTRLLKSRLRARRARVVGRWAVKKAMARLGLKGRRAWTISQLAALGRAVKADRVLTGTLRLQAMVRARGDVWELAVEQIDAVRGHLLGYFKRATAFGSAHGAALIRRFVGRILAYDPKAPVLAMTNPAPMRAPRNAPKIPGMAYVPAGEFIMGSERGELDESPRHIVHTDAFFIDLYEVTNAQYDKCVAARQCKRSTARRLRSQNGPDHPVAGVGYRDAVNYCAFAGKRVLTEAEWEKAARGSDERIYPWGNVWHDDRANMAWAKDGFKYTAPVGSYPKGASPYGVMDMAGNVWEWTADYYDPRYYGKSPAQNPRGPWHKEYRRKRRVMRGGSWMYSVPFFVTTHNRSPGRPWIRKRWVGIRCGKDAPK